MADEIWRVEVRDPAGEGEWRLWGRHPNEHEARMQERDYLDSHPGGEARVFDEALGPPAGPLQASEDSEDPGPVEED